MLVKLIFPSRRSPDSKEVCRLNLTEVSKSYTLEGLLFKVREITQLKKAVPFRFYVEFCEESVEILQPKFGDVSLYDDGSLYVELQPNIAQWNPKAGIYVLDDGIMKTDKTAIPGKAYILPIHECKKCAVIARFADSRKMILSKVVIPNRPKAVLSTPIITTAKLNRETENLTLDFEDVPNATAYTVIVSSRAHWYDAFRIKADQRTVQGVICTYCTVAIRALNANDESKFSGEFSMTVIGQPRSPKFLAFYDEKVLFIDSKVNIASVRLDNTFIQVVPIEPGAKTLIVETTGMILAVQVNNGLWFNVKQLDSTNSPIILKCNKYGPVVHVVVKQIDQRKFTPMFEGLIVKPTVVVSRASWYGYYGRIKGFSCQGCSLYIREILPDGYSAFSARTAVELSGSSRETYFTVEALNTGFRLRWQSETAIVISYTNMLTNRTAMIPSEKQDLVEHTLTELDSCTPYEFVGHFANSQDSEPWQTITITTEPEKPNITLFKAVSPTKTVLVAEWVTAGHCPLVYLINGIQYDAPIPRRFFGSPLLVTVSKEMGAILEPMKNGNYKVKMSYEIYNDPGCDKRFIYLVPSVDGSQIKAATTAVRRIGFEPYNLSVTVTRVKQSSGLNVRLLDSDPCPLKNYSVTLEEKSQKVTTYFSEESFIINPLSPCESCKLTVENIGYKSGAKPRVMDKIFSNPKFFTVQQSDRNITWNWNLPAASFELYRVDIIPPMEAGKIDSSASSQTQGFPIDSNIGNSSFPTKHCGTYQVILRSPEGMDEHRSVTIGRESDQVMVIPTISANGDGDKLKLDLISRNRCFGPYYHVKLDKSNGEIIERWVDESAAVLSNVTCAPCTLTVSIPNATNPVSPSEPVEVWFGLIQLVANAELGTATIGWEIPSKTLSGYAIHVELIGATVQTIPSDHHIDQHKGTHNETVSVCGTMQVKLKKDDEVVSETSIEIKPKEKYVDVSNIKYDTLLKRLTMDLAENQECLKGDLLVQLTDQSDNIEEYPVVNGKYSQIPGYVLCFPCKVIVKLAERTPWKLEPSGEFELFLGSMEISAEANATHARVNWTMPTKDDPIGFSICLRNSNVLATAVDCARSPVTKHSDSTTFPVTLCGPYQFVLEYSKQADHKHSPIVLIATEVFVPCVEQIKSYASMEAVAELFEIKRISILPIISTLVVCAICILFGLIQYQMEKLQKSSNHVNDDDGPVYY